MTYSTPFNVLLPLFLMVSLSASQTQAKANAGNQAKVAPQTTPLKPVYMPDAPYPEDAAKKHIQGKVTLRITVDAGGNVSDMNVLSGPQELVVSSVATARTWRFEPPASAPVVRTVEMSFGLDAQCPGPVSDSGTVAFTGRLLDTNGRVIGAYDDDYENPSPVYPEAERKAGVSGKMVVSLDVSAQGQAENIRVVNSLSPGLDQEAVDTVRQWRFKRIDPNSDIPLKGVHLVFLFRPTCLPNF